MHRVFLATLLLACSAAANAQQVFIAPTAHSIIASSEQSGGSDLVHVLSVTNRSSVPIIVFGVVLSSCENVKQWCSGRTTNILIPAGEQRTVGRVEPKLTDIPFSYRWNFSYRADSSDARALAALRENGLLPNDDARADAGRVSKVRTLIDTSSPPGIEQPLSREPLTEAERHGTVPIGTPESAGAPRSRVSFSFKVAYGSILGSTMMPGAPVQLLGPCINPAESAKLERDARITRTPWRPAVVDGGLARTALPEALRDSVAHGGDVLVRWVADTTGETVPASVRVLESPHPLMSVKVCTAVLGGRVTPARDQAGHAIRAWVQMPVRVTR